MFLRLLLIGAGWRGLVNMALGFGGCDDVVGLYGLVDRRCRPTL